MKGFPRLTIKRILKKHKSNPKDKDLHIAIETKGIKKDTFSKLIQQSTQQEPFDKKTKNDS